MIRFYTILFFLNAGLFHLHNPSLFAQTDSLKLSQTDSSRLNPSGSLTFSLGTGFSFSNIHDEFISPLQYHGGGYLFKVGMDKVSDRVYNHIEFIYHKNKIEPDVDNSSFANFYRWNIDWIRAWKIKSLDGPLSIFLGGHILSTYGAFYHQTWFNNTYSHSLGINVGPSVAVSLQPLSSNKGLLMSLELSLPILNYVIRPSHGSILPERAVNTGEENSGTFLTGGSITSLHEYLRIYSNIYLSYQFSPRICGRLGYQWDFQSYSVNNIFQSATHNIYIGLYYRIKK